jgi:type IV secretory pathway TrbL component
VNFNKILVKFNKIIDSIKATFNKIIKAISTYIAEIFVIAGAYFIILATFKLNTIAGLYCLGIILLLIGLFLAKNKQ